MNACFLGAWRAFLGFSYRWGFLIFGYMLKVVFGGLEKKAKP